MKHLKLYEEINRKWDIGDIVSVNGFSISGTGKIIGFEGIGNKTVVVEIDNKEYRVSYNNIKPSNELDPYDEEDWNEVDKVVRKKLKDNIGDYEEDGVIGIHFRELIENVRYYFGMVLRPEDIEFDGDSIFFYMFGDDNFGYFEPNVLLQFRDDMIQNSNYIEMVNFAWNSSIRIELSDEYEYELA